ncbi:MAG: rhodanese-like domain-containing protein [Flavobacteriales bacterium]|jgi:rhodanese-related sulfurtransferase|tara:strand:- start:2675 stop:3070 length:396 start_codon:yes stop_codon:yes gene_type:complete
MKQINQLFTIIALVFMLISSCTFAQNKNDIEITEFKTKIVSQKYILVDVRTESEFDDGHIKGAINIDYFSSTFSDEISELGLETPVLVYCKSGNRSGKAMKIMNDLRFKEVYNLTGGFKGWLSGKNTISKE